MPCKAFQVLPVMSMLMVLCLVAPIALGKYFVLLRFVKSIIISCLLWISVKVVGLLSLLMEKDCIADGE